MNQPLEETTAFNQPLEETTAFNEINKQNTNTSINTLKGNETAFELGLRGLGTLFQPGFAGTSGIGIMSFGAMLSIIGNLIDSQLFQLVGIGLLVPGILGYLSEISINFVKGTNFKSTDLVTLSVIPIIIVLFLFRSDFIPNLLLALGFIMVISGIVRKRAEPPPPRVEVRFVPRTFKEEQENPVQPSEIFDNMFSRPNPWPIG